MEGDNGEENHQCHCLGPASSAARLSWRTSESQERRSADCQIAKTNGKTLKLKTGYARDVTGAFDAIDQLSPDQPLYLTLSDGQTIVGTISSKDGRFEVTTKEAATVRVERSTVQTIPSKAEQDAYLAEVERYRNPQLVDLWGGSLHLGYSLRPGNSSANNLAIGANAVRETTRDKTSVYLGGNPLQEQTGRRRIHNNGERNAVGRSIRTQPHQATLSSSWQTSKPTKFSSWSNDGPKT